MDLTKERTGLKLTKFQSSLQIKDKVGEIPNDTFKHSFIHELIQQPPFRKRTSMQSTASKMHLFLLYIDVLEYGFYFKEIIHQQSNSQL